MDARTAEILGYASRWTLLALMAVALLIGGGVVLSYMAGGDGHGVRRIVVFDALVRPGQSSAIRGRFLGSEVWSGQDLFAHCEGSGELWFCWQHRYSFGSRLCPAVRLRTRAKVAGLPYSSLAMESDRGHLLALPAGRRLLLVDVRWIDRTQGAGLADEARRALRSARSAGELAYLQTGSIRAAAEYRRRLRTQWPEAVVFGRVSTGEVPGQIVHRLARSLGDAVDVDRIHLITDDPGLVRVARRLSLTVHWTAPARPGGEGGRLVVHDSLPKLAAFLDDIASKPSAGPSAQPPNALEAS